MLLKLGDLYSFARTVFMGLVILVLLKLFLPLLALQIPESVYTDGYILENLLHFSGLDFYIIYTLLCFAAIISFIKPIKLIDIALIPRWVLIFLICIQAYTLSLMDYNHYYDEWFLADRFLLVLITILTLWRPLLLPIFIVAVLMITHQLEYPIVLDYDSTHKSLIIPLLCVIWIYILFEGLFKRYVHRHLLSYLILSLMAIWYIQAGWAKFQLEWYEINNLYNLYAAALDSGWLSSLTRSMQISVGKFISDNRIILQYGGMIIELFLPLLLVIQKRIAIISMCVLIIFHLGVFLLSGIFFWQWILLEIIFIIVWVFKSDKMSSFHGFFQSVTFIVFIAFNFLFLRATTLAWFDSGYLNTFEFYIENEEGVSTRLYPSFFSPYDVGFAKNRFYFSREELNVSATLGNAKNVELLEILKGYNSENKNQIKEKLNIYRANHGWKIEDRKAKKEIFEDFLKKFTANKTNYDPKIISGIDPFIHMQTGTNQQNFSTGSYKTLKIVYEEKLVKPNLEFDLFHSDTLTLNLPQ